MLIFCKFLKRVVFNFCCITKAKLCGLISRHIVYRNTGYEKKGLQDMENAKTNILKIARMYNIDTTKSLPDIMNDLSRIIQ